MSSYIPLGNRVLARKIIPKKETESGLILPESAKPIAKINHAEVLLVGEGEIVDGVICESSINLNPGDIIIYSKVTFDLLEDNQVIIDGKDILALVKDS